jgi:hypothetical protein
METLCVLADQSIRRACGFAALGIGTLMLALSFDITLAFRSGAALAGLLCLGLAAAAWRAPHRDMRRTELWALLAGTAGEDLRRLPCAQSQAMLSGVLRARLLWHADRVGVAALALWLPALAFSLVR